jgi:hypothetical protein
MRSATLRERKDTTNMTTNLSPGEQDYLRKLEAAQKKRAEREADTEPHVGPTDEDVAAAKAAARSKRPEPAHD